MSLILHTENKDFRKKSRKNRAAKNLDTSMSSNNAELSDSIMSEIPEIPKISKKTTHMKKIEDAQTSKSFIKH